MTDVVELARELVRMPSTPDGGEPAIAELLANRLQDSGFTVSVDTYRDGTVGHANVVARWGDPERAAACLTGHLDTVTVVESAWSVDPWGADIVDGILYGRGCTDMKAGVAAIVSAAKEYVAAPPPDAQPLVLVLTAQEEVGSLGAARLAALPAGDPAALPDSRVLLVAEPTSNQPVLGHRGALWLDLVSTGRSCHGSTPHLGENAVEKLVDALRLVRDWAAANGKGHDVLGARTLNIGRVAGGVLRNIVPDAARAELDFRTPDPADVVDLPRALQQVVGELATVETAVSLPPVYTDPADPWVRLVLDVASGHVELTPEPGVARFFTDASVLTGALASPGTGDAAGGVPTVICGPGSPDQAHVVDEFCEVAQIVAAQRMYCELLRR